MAFKKDEVHVKQFSWKLRIVVTALCVAALLILVYLTVFSFANLNPMITVVLILVILLVSAIIIFAMDVAFAREVQ